MYTMPRFTYLVASDSRILEGFRSKIDLLGFLMIKIIMNIHS